MLPVSTPILSALTFNTISDSSLEIATNKDKFLPDIDQNLKHEVYKALQTDVCNNILYTIMNNIIESSTLTFNAWWSAMANKYFKFKENDKTINEFTLNLQPPAMFHNYITDNNYKYNSILGKSIHTFIANTLRFKYKDKCINTPEEILETHECLTHDYVKYVETTSINLTNFIAVVFIEALTNYLFKFVTFAPSYSIINTVISDSSDLLNKINNNKEGVIDVNFAHLCIESILEDSLYNVILTCIKPSIYNILETSASSFFYVYQDMYKESANKLEN